MKYIYIYIYKKTTFGRERVSARFSHFSKKVNLLWKLFFVFFLSLRSIRRVEESEMVIFDARSRFGDSASAGESEKTNE